MLFNIYLYTTRTLIMNKARKKITKKSKKEEEQKSLISCFEFWLWFCAWIVLAGSFSWRSKALHFTIQSKGEESYVCAKMNWRSLWKCHLRMKAKKNVTTFQLHLISSPIVHNQRWTQREIVECIIAPFGPNFPAKWLKSKSIRVASQSVWYKCFSWFLLPFSLQFLFVVIE